MEKQILGNKKAHSRWPFVILCAMFLSLYILRDLAGLQINYYIIYAVALFTVMVVSAEEAVCFFLALSVFSNAGLNGVFCTALFGCILLRFIFTLRNIKLYSALLVVFVVAEFLFFLAYRKILIGSYLTYGMTLLTLVIVQQYPQDKLDKSFILNTFMVFSLVYIIIVIISVTVEYGSVEELLKQGLRTEEFKDVKETNTITPNQNIITQLCSLNLALCVVKIKRKYNPVLYGFAIVLFLVCGLLTVSKMFMVVLVALALYIAVMTMKKNLLNGIGVLAILAVVVAVVYYYFGDTLIDMVLTRFETEDLTTGRTDINKSLLEYMGTHPWMYLIGSGVLQVHFLMDHAVHSSFFEILGGWGFPGLVLASAYILMQVKEARYNIRTQGWRIDAFSYLPLLLYLGYTLNGMLFGQAFSIVHISVCIYAMQLRENGEHVV